MNISDKLKSNVRNTKKFTISITILYIVNTTYNLSRGRMWFFFFSNIFLNKPITIKQPWIESCQSLSGQSLSGTYRHRPSLLYSSGTKAVLHSVNRILVLLLIC